MKKFFIKIYMYFIIFSVVFFGVVIVVAFNATDGDTAQTATGDDTTTQYSAKQRFINSIPTFGGGHKHWVVSEMKGPAHRIYRHRSGEVWKYRDSRTGQYAIFYFDNSDMLIDYKIGTSY